MDGADEPLHRARLEALAAHSRFVAHGLGNVMTGLSLTLELLEATTLTGVQRRYVERCLHLAGRLSREKELLAALGGGSMQPPGWVDTRQMVQASLARHCAAADLDGSWQVEPGAEWAWGDALLLAEALSQLVRNACDALVHGGRLGIVARPSTPQEAGLRGGITFTVWDDGPGLPAQLRPLLGRAPVSTKSHGTGMGLLTVVAIVERLHGGRFRLSDRLPRGTAAQLNLPSAPPAA